MQLAGPLRIHAARHLGQVEIDTCKDREDGTQRHHVVEVCNHVVRVVVVTVHSGLRQNDTCDTTNGEEEQEAESPKHRCFEFNGPAPHCGNPAEYFNTGGNRDHHRRKHKVGLLI